ncbi:MAG TPA: multicopper oxidase family protein [Longimicrobiaceae bacterium]|nr:multicopper oxidase family protein [Longimicrobiaceae bacterium]
MRWSILAGTLLAAVILPVLPAVAQGLPGSAAFTNPPEIRSAGGQLRTRLVAAPGTFTLGGATYRRNLYNGSYVPPTLRVRRGDWFQLTLLNQMDSARWTNLHYHGMTVTPRVPGDNVFLHIANQDSFRYAFAIPQWHAPGMFWYHPHPHGLSEGQVLGGMSGALIVEGLLDRYPQWQGITERVMLLKDFVNPSDPDGPKIKSINGQTSSTLYIRPGEPQFWRIGNVGADAYYNLKLDGHRFLVIARDGNPTVKPIPADSLFLPPSSRVEVIVYGGRAGAYRLWSDSIQTGPAGDPNPAVTLGQVISVGEPVPGTSGNLPQREDHALAESARRLLSVPIHPPKRVVFSEDTVSNVFFINGKVYDPNRIDTRVRVGDNQEWVLVNDSDELHVFHIHQLDFIVTEINGVPQPYTGFQDTVNLPFRQNGIPGQVRIRLSFWNPDIVGKFVYHCHILEHEDGGMMANIQVDPQ